MASFALRHAYLVLFAATLVEQLGLPLPVAPLLIGAGALARANQLLIVPAIALYLLASALAHLVWFEAGRRRGASVLKLVCKLSLEPDSCVRRTQNLFGRYGDKLLLAAPFTPGLGMVAPPLAGLSGMKRLRFLMIDSGGSLLWSGALVAAGWFVGPQLQILLEALKQVAGSLTAGVLLLFAGWLIWKVIDRQRLFAQLRVARITAPELREKLLAGEIVAIDLRHPAEIAAEGFTVPGSLHFTFDELETRHVEIPRDKDIALFCS